MLEHILLAWDGSLEVSRTIALAMPMLQVAAKLSVCTWIATADTALRPETDPILSYLRYNDVVSELSVEESGSSRIGGSLLTWARKEKATLICMGAYSQPRAVQVLIGGNTQHVYHHSPIPILLSA
jgi:nucleotide-binding universal stress UspA family protein